MSRFVMVHSSNKEVTMTADINQLCLVEKPHDYHKNVSEHWVYCGSKGVIITEKTYNKLLDLMDIKGEDHDLS